MIDFSDRNVEFYTQSVFETADYVTLFFKGMGMLDEEFESEDANCGHEKATGAHR